MPHPSVVPTYIAASSTIPLRLRPISHGAPRLWVVQRIFSPEFDPRTTLNQISARIGAPNFTRNRHPENKPRKRPSPKTRPHMKSPAPFCSSPLVALGSTWVAKTTLFFQLQVKALVSCTRFCLPPVRPAVIIVLCYRCMFGLHATEAGEPTPRDKYPRRSRQHP